MQLSDEREKMGLATVKRTAESFATRRVLSIGKGQSRFKVSSRELKSEIETASVYGELSALERILTVIQQNPGMTREDIEAEIHLSVVDYNNFIKDYTGYGLTISLDVYLGMRGYFGKEAHLSTAQA